MAVHPENRRWLFLALTHTALAVLLLAVIDMCLQPALTNVRRLRLCTGWAKELSRFQSEIQTLHEEIGPLAAKISSAGNRSPLSLLSVQAVASKHRLTLTKAERVTCGNRPTLEHQRYQATFQGSLAGILRFLRDLEHHYRCRIESTDIQPTNEKGSTLELSIVIVTSAQ